MRNIINFKNIYHNNTPSRFFNKNQVKKLKKLVGKKCEVCNSNKKLQADHWFPYSKYYKIYNKKVSCIGNCVILCEKCNTIKADNLGIFLVKEGLCDYDVWKKINDRVKILSGINEK